MTLAFPRAAYFPERFKCLLALICRHCAIVDAFADETRRGKRDAQMRHR